MSDTTTRGVRIVVAPRHLREQSQPERSQYAFAYHVTIRNVGAVPVQLLSRHWIITDGEGHTEEVRGPGVVGQQPRLSPGEAFEYTSGCPLRTPVGTMHGSFQMVANPDQSGEGENFDAYIEPFRLAVPNALN